MKIMRKITVVLAAVLVINTMSVVPAAAEEEEKIDIASSLVTKDLSNFVETMKFNGKDRINNVRFYYNGKLLQSEKDFKVEYSDNFFVGTAEVKYTGIGDFTGEFIKKFYIVKMPVSEITTKASYNSKGVLVVSANNGSYGMDLNKDYTYTTYVDFYGDVTVTFTGIGDNYTGTFIRVIENEDTPITATSSYLKTVTLTKVKNVKKKSIVVKWKKLKNVTGYKLKYTNKKTGKSTTVKLDSKAKSYTIPNCKKKANYSVKIRSYIRFEGKTYNSDWSKIYKVKIKK